MSEDVEDHKNETDRVFKDAKRFSQMFKGFLQAAELWNEIGSFHEAKARVDALKAEIADLTMNRDAIIAEHKRAADEELADVRRNAEDRAKALLSKVDALGMEGV
jgi:hypothetical protein